MTRAKGTPKCGAPKKSDGKPCRNTAGYKTSHQGVGTCHLHLGNSPSHVKNAVEAQAQAAALRWGEPIVTTGIDALLGLLYHWSGIEAFYRARVQALDPDAFVWGETQRADDASRGTKATSAAGVNVWVKLHAEASTKLADIAEQCVRAGLDERRIRLAEQQGQLLVAGLQWLFARLELSARKAELANRLVLEMLRALNAGQVPVLEGSTS